MKNFIWLVIIIAIFTSSIDQPKIIFCNNSNRKLHQIQGTYPYTEMTLNPPLLPENKWSSCKSVELYKKYLILNKYTDIVEAIDCENGKVIDEKVWDSIPYYISGKMKTSKINNSEILENGYCLQINATKYLVVVSSGQYNAVRKDYVCLYDNFKYVWSIPVDYGKITLLTENRAIIGVYNVKLVNLDTGDICLEYQSNYQIDCKFDDEVAIIDNDIVVEIDSGKILWSFREKYKYLVYHRLFLIGDYILDIFEGKYVFYNRMTGMVAKEFLDKNSISDASGVIDTCVYGSSGRRFRCYDFEKKINLVSYEDQIILGGNVKFANDEDNIYICDEYGIFCYNVKDKKFKWKNDLSSYKKAQEYNGKTYVNMVHRNDAFQLTETLYLVDNGSFKEIISVNHESIIYDFYWQNQFFLMPTEKGILHIPSLQRKNNPPCLYDYQTKNPIISYNIQNWGEYSNSTLFSLSNHTLVICCDSMSVDIVNIDTGETNNILLLGAKGSYPVSIVSSEEHALVTLGYESYAVDLKEKKLKHVLDIQHRISNPLFIFNEWLVATGDPKTPGITLLNLDTFESMKSNHVYLGTTENAIIAYNPEDNYCYKKYFSDIQNMEKIYIEKILGSNPFTFNKYHCVSGGITNLEDGKFIQKLSIFANKSPFPFEEKLSQNNNGTIYTFTPCQSFSIRRINTTKFEIELTRDTKEAGILDGKAYLVPTDENGKYLPALTDVTNNLASIHLDAKNKKQVLEFENIDEGMSIFRVDDSISKKDKLGLLIVSNGLLDTKNSELSDFDKEGRPLFDGVPTSLEKQQAIVVTVWEK